MLPSSRIVWASKPPSMNTLLMPSVVPKSKPKTNLRLNYCALVGLPTRNNGSLHFAWRMKASTSPASFAGTRERWVHLPRLAHRRVDYPGYRRPIHLNNAEKARIAPGFCRTFRFSVATLVQVVWTPVRGLSCRITPGRPVLNALCNGAVARLFYRVSVTIGPTNRVAMAFVLGMRREREKYQENERRNRLHEIPQVVKPQPSANTFAVT
jgi:hypothetical protein